jgi:hypothetical protein
MSCAAALSVSYAAPAAARGVQRRTGTAARRGALTVRAGGGSSTQSRRSEPSMWSTDRSLENGETMSLKEGQRLT